MEEQDALVVLPLGRVRRLMKESTSIRAVTQEASLLVAKAAELFIESLTARALECKTGEGNLAFSDLGTPCVPAVPAAACLCRAVLHAVAPSDDAPFSLHD